MFLIIYENYFQEKRNDIETIFFSKPFAPCFPELREAGGTDREMDREHDERVSRAGFQMGAFASGPGAGRRSDRPGVRRGQQHIGHAQRVPRVTRDGARLFASQRDGVEKEKRRGNPRRALPDRGGERGCAAFPR